MSQTEPGDREEMLLQGILNGDTTTNIEPGSREEALLAGILRGDSETNIEPGSRKEALLKAILEDGGLRVEVEPLSVTENGEYDAGEGKAYNPVNVDVAPVTGGKEITENGTFIASDDGVDGYDVVTVNVSANIKSGKIISANGTYNAGSEGYDGYAEVEVAVPAGASPTLFSSEGTIASPDATVTSGNLLQAAIADHHYFELSFEFGDATVSLPVTFAAGGKAVASRVGFDPVDGVVSLGTIEYVLSNLQLSLDVVFLAQMNTDGTGFVDMTSMLPTSTPATITGYYWN